MEKIITQKGKLIAAILILLVLLTQVLYVFGTSSDTMEDYDDVSPSSWYYADVKEARKAGYVIGVGNNLYRPDTEITYAQYLTVTARIVSPSIDNTANTNPWYKKYIDYSETSGILTKNETITPTVGIPRQDMVKYTCKALGIEPYTGNEILFNDVSPKDAAYINAAYNAYLIDGTKLPLTNKPGLFGFDTNAKRSELAAMANRLAEYKRNPKEFKARRSAERAEQKAKAESTNYTEYNGYKIPKRYNQVVPEDSIDFYGLIRFKTHPEDFDDMQYIIASKFGDKVAKQAIDYARTKVNRVNLPFEDFYTDNGYEITVFSARTAPHISIQISKID